MDGAFGYEDGCGLFQREIKFVRCRTEFRVCHDALISPSNWKDNGADDIVQFRLTFLCCGGGNPRMELFVAIADAVTPITQARGFWKDVEGIIQKSRQRLCHIRAPLGVGCARLDVGGGLVRGLKEDELFKNGLREDSALPVHCLKDASRHWALGCKSFHRLR
jgi:hypothetical protein